MVGQSGRRNAAFPSLLVTAAVLPALAHLLSIPAFAQPYAYVANLGSDDVSVIDARTNSVIATVPVGQGPDGIVATSDGSRVYVTNFVSGTVSVIDTRTNTVLATIPVGSGPVGLALAPNDTLAYVANRGSNSVSVIDTAAGSVVATIPVGSGPDAVAVTPNGAAAYVTNSFTSSPGTVSVINTATNSVTATVAVGRTPNRVAVTPDGCFAYVANFRSWNLSAIDTATNTVTTTIPVFGRPSGVTVHPNGAYVYVVNLGGRVQVVDTSTMSSIDLIAVADEPYGISTTRSGGVGYVADFASNMVSVLDLVENVERFRVPVGVKPFAVTLNCVGSGCAEPPYTPKPTPTPTITPTLLPTATPTPTGLPTATRTPTFGPVSIEIGSTTGGPGDTVSIVVTLHASGAPVAATQNDIAFDRSVPVAARADARPDCTANPDIRKGGSAFSFLPPSCVPGRDCQAIRALVLALDNLDAIPDRSVLYTCSVAIAADAAPGVYSLTSANVAGSDPHGQAINAAGIAGYVTVAASGVSQLQAARAPEATATDSGCQIGGSVEGWSGWMCLISAALLLWLVPRAHERS
jgi:YVTN family beta-propeller protein